MHKIAVRLGVLGSVGMVRTAGDAGAALPRGAWLAFQELIQQTATWLRLLCELGLYES